MRDLTNNIELLQNDGKNIIYLYSYSDLEIYLHMEYAEESEEVVETYLVKNKNSRSKVTFCEIKTGIFCIFVHEGINTFYDEANINSIKSKSWCSDLILNDLNSICESYEKNREVLKELSERNQLILL